MQSIASKVQFYLLFHKPLEDLKHEMTFVFMHLIELFRSTTFESLLNLFQESVASAAVLDKPKKANKSRFSVDIGKKPCFQTDPDPLFQVKEIRMRIQIRLAHISQQERNSDEKH